MPAYGHRSANYCQQDESPTALEDQRPPSDAGRRRSVAAVEALLYIIQEQCITR